MRGWKMPELYNLKIAYKADYEEDIPVISF
jgi:hypothetical protein